MKEWKFKDVSSKEFDEGLRRAKVPEHLIQELREEGEAYKRSQMEKIRSSLEFLNEPDDT